MRVVITLVLFLSLLSFAQETDAVESRQKAVLLALDSIEENVMGFSLNGRAKGGMLSSTLKSDALPNAEDVAENSMFSDFLLGISVRPSSETKASFDLRFHKDWQSAYREGNNSPVIRWWSYDGNILEKRLKFNLGTMRLAYTPLTVYLPEPELIMEPEIFYNLKKDAMEERYLDGSNRRLLQGLNAEYRVSLGVIDTVLMQGSILRLKRNQISKISYDFDPLNDRYSTAARLGFKISGLSIGVNDVYTFDRVSSSVRLGDSLNNEKNNVLSFELGYNGKKLLEGPVNFGVNAEYAISRWQYGMYTRTRIKETGIKWEGIDSLIPSNTLPGSGNIEFYPHPYIDSSKTEYTFIGRDEQFNKGALLASAFVSYKQNPFEAKLSGHFLNTDKDFESELAASPAYLPNLPILNSHADLTSSAFEQFRSGSLESMYYSLYYSLPMNAITIVSGKQGVPEEIVGNEIYKSKNLYNNYKFSQYYNNAYTQRTYTRYERARDSIVYRLDPAVNLALPYGYATPDRSGGDADLNFVWNKAVSVKGVFGKYSSSESDYTRLGGGLEVNIANLADLSKAFVISASYEQNKEENGRYNPTVDRIMAGAKIGIWRGLSLLCGFQQLDKTFEKAYMDIVDQTNERLIIGGPQIKISEGADFSLLGGLLSNSIKGGGTELNLDKYTVSGVVTVGF